MNREIDQSLTLCEEYGKKLLKTMAEDEKMSSLGLQKDLLRMYQEQLQEEKKEAEKLMGIIRTIRMKYSV